MAGFSLGAAGAAIATIFAQLISVFISFLLIRKKALPFSFERSQIKLRKRNVRKIIGIGLPIAMQDFLVSISFLIILAIVNQIGLNASAVVMFYMAFFRGDMLSYVFANDTAVILASSDYLKAYALDCLLTCFYFCFVGYFNGIGTTKFVMIQGIIGAFGIRVPLSIIFSHLSNAMLSTIGLATPASTLVQTCLCIIWFIYVHKKQNIIKETTVLIERDGSYNEKQYF